MSPPHTTVSLHRTTDDGRRVQIPVDILGYVTRILTPQLEDPLKPRCCPLCFSVCSATFQKDDNHHALAYLLLHNHDFFAACVATLAAPRGYADIKPLRAQLDENSARCSNTAWHPFVWPQAVANPLELFLSALIVCVSSALRNAKSKGWFKSRARKGIWPTSPEQLLPYGPLPSVASYVFWCATLLSPYTVPLLVAFLEVARSSFLPLFLAPPQKDLLMKSLLLMFQGPPNGPADDAPVSMWKLPADCGHFLVPQQAAATFLNTVLQGAGNKPGDLDELFDGYDGLLCSALLSATDSNAIHDGRLRFTMGLIAQQLHKKLALPPSRAQTALNDRLHQFQGNLSLPKGIPHDAAMVYAVLRGQFDFKACAGAECGGAAKQACARCRLVRYCGRDCQRADWKVPQGGEFGVSVTHQAVCPIICRLHDAGVSAEGQQSVPERLARFFDAYRRAGISDADYRELISWGVATALIPPSALAHSGVTHLPSFL